MKSILVLSILLTIGCAPAKFKYITGQDGQDGKDNVVLSTDIAEPGECKEVYPDVYVENIRNGYVFDVYANAECKDRLGEYCDNVVPVNDATGRVDDYRGSGTVCWANNLQISGVKLDDNSIKVYILEFL